MPPSKVDLSRQLPPEILSKIFSYHQAHDAQGPEMHWSSLTKLMLVCKRWRAIVESHPFLWTSLDVRLPLNPLKKLDATLDYAPEDYNKAVWKLAHASGRFFSKSRRLVDSGTGIWRPLDFVIEGDMLAKMRDQEQHMRLIRRAAASVAPKGVPAVAVPPQCLFTFTTPVLEPWLRIFNWSSITDLRIETGSSIRSIVLLLSMCQSTLKTISVTLLTANLDYSHFPESDHADTKRFSRHVEDHYYYKDKSDDEEYYDEDAVRMYLPHLTSFELVTGPTANWYSLNWFFGKLTFSSALSSFALALDPRYPSPEVSLGVLGRALRRAVHLKSLVFQGCSFDGEDNPFKHEAMFNFLNSFQSLEDLTIVTGSMKPPQEDMNLGWMNIAARSARPHEFLGRLRDIRVIVVFPPGKYPLWHSEPDRECVRVWNAIASSLIGFSQSRNAMESTMRWDVRGKPAEGVDWTRLVGYEFL